MSGGEATPALRWEGGRDAYDREVWTGHGGAEWVAWVWPHVAPGVCRWSLTLDSDGPLGDGGDAPTLDAAKAAAQAAWAAWCERAGLVAREAEDAPAGAAPAHPPGPSVPSQDGAAARALTLRGRNG